MKNKLIQLLNCSDVNELCAFFQSRRTCLAECEKCPFYNSKAMKELVEELNAKN